MPNDNGKALGLKIYRNLDEPEREVVVGRFELEADGGGNEANNSILESRDIMKGHESFIVKLIFI
jgi:hypothetical protein